MGRVRGRLPRLRGRTRPDPRTRAVVDEFGVSDLSVLADEFDERMRTALADPRHPVHRYRATETNPVDLVRDDAPPFLFLHGDDDRIIPPAQTLALHRARREVGADSTTYWPGPRDAVAQPPSGPAVDLDPGADADDRVPRPDAADPTRPGALGD